MHRHIKSTSLFRNSFLRRYSTKSKKLEVVAKFTNGRSLKLQCGEYARMAAGSAIATMGGTTVLVGASSKPRPGNLDQSFLPLTVDYKQKYSAAGRIPSNYLKREMGISEQEILTSRVIDRSLRPIFPTGFSDDVQLTCNLMVVDGVHSPDVVSINAASAALSVSPIPFGGPVGAVRVAIVEDEVIVSPTRRELEHSEVDLVVTGGPNNTMVMLEGGFQSVHLPKLQKAIKIGVRESQTIIKAIQQLMSEVGKPKNSFELYTVPQNIMDSVRTLGKARLVGIFSDSSYDKQSRDRAVQAVREDLETVLSKEHPCAGDAFHIRTAFSKLTKTVFREMILDTGIRCDGRDETSLRDISCRADVFPGLHGSSLFQRGQTQLQCTVAFDSNHSNSSVNPLLMATGGLKESNFVLNYTFPAFATDELRKGGGLSRREVGHGALAEKAIRPVLPEELPYTVLLDATVLESNGSSSMATVCGGSLALYDSGVKLKAPVAGVAMGLVTETDEQGQIIRHKILTDILGIEDYMGDMDFKIAGTPTGITALQADVKLPGIPLSFVMETLQQATAPRNKILELMNTELKEPREDKDGWPVFKTLEVPPSKRGGLMGPGGVNIKRIMNSTGVDVWWEDSDNISVFAPNQMAYDTAMEKLEVLLKADEPTFEMFSIYNAKVEEVRQIGLMISLYDGMKPTLLHKNLVSDRRVDHAEALGIKAGDVIKVKYLGRDPVSGQMRLSKRAVQSSQVIHTLHRKQPA